MGIQINGNTDSISASDGGLSISGADIGSASASSLNISGIVTATGGLNVGAGGTVITTTAGGNVGIGTDDPQRKLEIGGIIRSGNNTSTNGSTIIEGKYFQDNVINIFGSQYSSGATVIGYCARPKEGSSGYVSSAGNSSFQKSVLEVNGQTLEFKSAAAATVAIGSDVGLTTSFKVHSTGEVSMPGQVRFSAYDGAAQTGGSAYKIEFSSANVNVGGNYSTSNDRFTAPVAGDYYFMYRVMAGAATYLRCQFKVNGSYVLDQFFSENVIYANNVGAMIYSLSVGDYVEVWCDVGDNGQGDIHGSYRCFVGYLIG